MTFLRTAYQKLVSPIQVLRFRFKRWKTKRRLKKEAYNNHIYPLW